MVYQNENFKKVPGYNDYYVSESGKVLSTKYKIPRILKSWKTPRGYLSVILCKGVKKVPLTVHRIVIMTFVGVSKHMQINHRNGIKTDNRLENLEYCTGSENQKHKCYVLGKTTRPVICSNGVIYPSIIEASRQLNISSGNISNCVNGKLNSINGYVFKDVDK